MINPNPPKKELRLWVKILLGIIAFYGVMLSMLFFLVLAYAVSHDSYGIPSDGPQTIEECEGAGIGIWIPETGCVNAPVQEEEETQSRSHSGQEAETND